MALAAPRRQWQHAPMVAIRKSFEEGHRRKFLVVVDDTAECDRAIVYAAKRAERTGGVATLLYVIAPGDFQHWIGVEDIMPPPARVAAGAGGAGGGAGGGGGPPTTPELVVREGNRSDEILQLIEEDADIAILVLAAGSGTEGPGPLVTAIVGKGAGSFPIPVTIVPGTLDDESIAALA